LRKDGYTEDEIGALFFNLYEKKPASTGSKPAQSNNGQIFSLIGASFLIAGISMLAIPTWLSVYAIPLIILGAISLGIKYIFQLKINKIQPDHSAEGGVSVVVITAFVSG
jgi:hypothetical protein